MSAHAGHGLNEQVALQAAEWFFLLNSDEATADDRERCAQWRAADPAHETAWQRAEHVNQRFQMLPRDVAMPVLNRPIRSDRRRAIKRLAMLLVVAPAGWASWRLAAVHPWFADHRTQTGERREVLLPDGSRLTLNTASAVDVAYDGSQRLLRLREGEILIDTAADSVASGQPGHRPFLVETPAGIVRAIGTRFVVRQLDAGTPWAYQGQGAGLATGNALPADVPHSGVAVLQGGGGNPSSLGSRQCRRTACGTADRLHGNDGECAGRGGAARR